MKKTTLLFEGIRDGFSAFGKRVSSLIVSLVLLIIFIFGIGIVAIFSKAVGKRFLHVRKDPRAPTYWTESIIKKRTKEDYLRPF